MFIVVPYKTLKEAMMCTGNDAVVEMVEDQISSGKLYIQDTNDMVVERVSCKDLIDYFNKYSIEVYPIEPDGGTLELTYDDLDLFDGSGRAYFLNDTVVLDNYNGFSITVNGKTTNIITFIRVSVTVVDDEYQYTWLIKAPNSKYYKMFLSIDSLFS